jgi:hypothetical protein
VDCIVSDWAPGSEAVYPEDFPDVGLCLESLLPELLRAVTALTGPCDFLQWEDEEVVEAFHTHGCVMRERVLGVPRGLDVLPKPIEGAFDRLTHI